MPTHHHDPALLLLEGLADHVEGTWLVAGDDGRVAQALADRGAEVCRVERHSLTDAPTQALPPAVEAERAVLALPRGRPAFAFALETLAARMVEGGVLYVYGANDEGIKSAHKVMGPWFDEVDKVDARRHSRLLSAVRTSAPARADLDAYAEPVELELPRGPFAFTHFPGLFAKGELDPGTELLLRALEDFDPKRPVRKVLDFACGMGVIAAGVHQRWPEATIHALDADALAVEATRRALPDAKVVLSNGYRRLGTLDDAGRYDLIVSNPPLHSGKSLDMSILDELVTDARAWLHRKGTLILVAQRQRPLPELPGKHPRLLADDRRYRVWAIS